MSGLVTVIKELHEVVPDLHTLRMRYEDGGKTEVWFTDGWEVRVPGGSKPEVIRAAFEKAKE